MSTQKFRADYPLFDNEHEEDDDDEEHDDEDDDENDDHDHDEDDVDSPPAAGFSTSPSICATPASVGKRPMSSKQAAPVVKRLCMQAKLSSFFTKAILSTSKASGEGF